MGDINQLIFVKNNIDIVKGPILDIGSKDYGNTANLRSLFPDFQYIGVDLEEGKGVDLVMDLTDDFELIDQKLNGIKLKQFFC